jgi:hypothetical protein
MPSSPQRVRTRDGCLNCRARQKVERLVLVAVDHSFSASIRLFFTGLRQSTRTNRMREMFGLQHGVPGLRAQPTQVDEGKVSGRISGNCYHGSYVERCSPSAEYGATSKFQTRDEGLDQESQQLLGSSASRTTALPVPPYR